MRKLIVVVFWFFSILMAVPANPEPGLIRYSDGRTLTVYLRGDENISWHESKDGHLLLRNSRGIFEYALTAGSGGFRTSGVKAHDPGSRSVKEKAFISDIPPIHISPEKQRSTERIKAVSPTSVPFEQTNFPTLGEQKFLLIMVEFDDLSFTHRPADFDSLMNGKNYMHNGAAGSVGQYYKDASFGRFEPHFDVVGPVKLDSGYAFYGKGDDDNIQLFVYEAVTKADPLVDFSQYDNDNDGFVDNIYFIYAGYGECFYGADENTIWPHRWAYLASTLTADGKRIYDYSTSMELYGTSGTTRTSIGVICHEFGHVCGLPDYYDTDYEGSGGNCGGLGQWDLMAGGSWNDAGKRPPLFNAWSRMYLRWAEPVELSGTEFVTLNPAHTDNEVRYFFSQTEGEFFMMENRQRSGWDTALPGHGLLMFHIDMNHSGWNNNTLNCNPYRQGFDLEEADGYGNITASYIDGGDPFPGTESNTEFLDSGSPNALDWAGRSSRSPIRNITENEGVISFNFGDDHVDIPGSLQLFSLGYDSIRLDWSLNAAADSVIIVSSREDDIDYLPNYSRFATGDSAAGGEVIYKGIDTMFYHTGLFPGTRYNYGIFSFNDSSYVYSNKLTASASTDSPPFFETGFTEGLPRGWLIVDRTGNGGWSADNPGERSFNARSAGDGFMIIDSEYAGDKEIDTEMITQSFNFALSRSVLLRFEHKLLVESLTLARVLYTVNDGKTWYEAGRWTENTSDPEISELDLTAAVAGFRNVKFKFDFRGSGEKYWCIDDLTILSALNEGVSAGFHLAERSGSKPFTVQFMNTTVAQPNAIDTVIWEFGDGSDFNTGNEPEYTYTRSGTYSISLTIQANGMQSNYKKDDFIHVINDAPVFTGNDTLNVRKNTASSCNLQQYFMDPNGDPLHFSWEGNSTELSIEARNDSIIDILPGNEYLGIETVKFIAEDNEGDTVSRHIDIWVSETAVNNDLPKTFICGQNYPNPFNAGTAISYQLPESRKVSLNIYDLNGTPVRTLVDDYQKAGYYTVQFHAGDLPSGMYVYRLSAGPDIKTKKMILLK